MGLLIYSCKFKQSITQANSNHMYNLSSNPKSGSIEFEIGKFKEEVGVSEKVDSEEEVFRNGDSVEVGPSSEE